MTVGDLILLAYGIGYVATWRSLFRVMADDLGIDDAGDLAMVLFTSAYFNIFWPAFLLWWIFRRAVPDPKRFARAVGGETREQKTKRLEREREERERRIETLERELGIG